jgi:hypothetical protein
LNRRPSGYEGILRYTPTHASPKQPMKSAKTGQSFRIVSAAFVASSRTITRTISCYAVKDGSYPTPDRFRHRGNHFLNCSCRADLEKAQAIKLRPVGFRSYRNQSSSACERDALFCSTPRAKIEFPSDCLPDAPQQLFDCAKLAGECPRVVACRASTYLVNLQEPSQFWGIEAYHDLSIDHCDRRCHVT